MNGFRSPLRQSIFLSWRRKEYSTGFAKIDSTSTYVRAFVFVRTLLYCKKMFTHLAIYL